MAGLLTLAQLRTELYYALDSSDEFDPSVASGQANCDQALNFSYLRLQIPTVFDHIETQTTQTITLATGNRIYPMTMFAINNINYNLASTPRRLRPMDIRQQGSMLIANGPPTRYAHWGTNIYLDFLPTATENGTTLTAYGWAQPTTLSASGPASILNIVFDEVILVGGKWRGWRRLGEGPKADMFREEYAALVNDNKDILSVESHDTGRVPTVGSAPPDYESTW